MILAVGKHRGNLPFIVKLAQSLGVMSPAVESAGLILLEEVVGRERPAGESVAKLSRKFIDIILCRVKDVDNLLPYHLLVEGVGVASVEDGADIGKVVVDLLDEVVTARAFGQVQNIMAGGVLRLFLKLEGSIENPASKQIVVFLPQIVNYELKAFG